MIILRKCNKHFPFPQTELYNIILSRLNGLDSSGSANMVFTYIAVLLIYQFDRERIRDIPTGCTLNRITATIIFELS